MIIKSFLNCTEQDIKSKKFNIFVGISLGNKYFSKENIRAYLRWALENTKDDVLVLIADTVHAINYEVFDGYSSERALQVTLRKGMEIEKSIEEIVRSLPKEKQSFIKIGRWDDVKKSQYYKDKIKIFLNEFKQNNQFHDFIIKIVQENLGSRASGLALSKLEKLSSYVLDELPIILNGVEFEGKIYDLHPYPEFSCLDDLLMGLQNGTLFPELSKILEIKNKVAEVEAVVG
ncbi:tRNA-dependent cyclodipeptide synthase [Patescibacteria group bacterium]